MILRFDLPPTLFAPESGVGNLRFPGTSSGDSCCGCCGCLLGILGVVGVVVLVIVVGFVAVGFVVVGVVVRFRGGVRGGRFVATVSRFTFLICCCFRGKFFKCLRYPMMRYCKNSGGPCSCCVQLIPWVYLVKTTT